jgi:transposase
MPKYGHPVRFEAFSPEIILTVGKASRYPADRGPATAPVAGAGPGQAEPGAPGGGRRRSFTAEYKLKILASYDAAEPGEKGGILRREGLYSSHIVDWRRTRDAGAFAALARPRGRPAADPRDAQIAQLRKERTRLARDLARARLVAAVQTKTAGALGDALRGNGHRSEADAVIDQAIAALAPWVGTRAACAAVGESQATYYRRHRVGAPDRKDPVPAGGKARRPAARSLAEPEGTVGLQAGERPGIQGPAARLTRRRATARDARSARLSKS